MNYPLIITIVSVIFFFIGVYQDYKEFKNGRTKK